MSVYSLCDSVNIGDTTHFYLLANKVPDVIGFQFTLEWDNHSLGFLNIEDNKFGINFSQHLSSDGYLVGSWYENNLLSSAIDSSDTLFSIKFKVQNQFIQENSSYHQMLQKRSLHV